MKVPNTITILLKKHMFLYL